MSETDEIAWLRTVLEQATPGPWESREWEDLAAVVGKGGRGWVLEGDVVPAGQDARAVAALGTLWPELLAAVEVLVSRECAGCNLGYALREAHREDGSACVEHHGGPRGRRWVMACSVPLAEHRVRVALRDAIRAHRERVDAGE